ncbi:hypothetical protein AB4084_27310, partial [Lysobacter sp. 2RAB21]
MAFSVAALGREGLIAAFAFFARHSRESGNPVAFVQLRQSRWIPAFAGMTSLFLGNFEQTL